ncbi:MAG: hypothetical protein MK052_02705 [Alphaproteobacteria bacterium]|nr:hypothetical protein [Alphaproteobacteria bacterium]
MLLPATNIEPFFDKLTSITHLLKEGKTEAALSEVMRLVTSMSLSEVVMFQEVMIDFHPEESSGILIQRLCSDFFSDEPAAYCLRQMFVEELNAQAVFPLRSAAIS